MTAKTQTAANRARKYAGRSLPPSRTPNPGNTAAAPSKATQIARIDPEEFYDFQSTRPEVSLIDGTTRKVSWPANEYYSARVDEVGRDLVLFSGVEPNLKWRTFCSTVIGVAKETGCEMVVTLDDFLRRRSKIALVERREVIRNSPGLMDACRILFGDEAQASRANLK